MKYLLLLLLVIVSPTFAGELIIKAPADAKVFIDGVLAPADEKNAELRKGYFDDSKLDPAQQYYYEVEVQSVNLKTPIKENVKIKIGGIVTVDYTVKSKEIPKAATIGVPSKKIPAFYSKNEALEGIYESYVTHGTTLKKEDLHLDDKEQKYKCQVWTVPEANTLDREVVLDGKNAASGRLVHVAMNDIVNDKQEKFLLIQKDNGWRGSLSTPSQKQAISAEKASTLFKFNEKPYAVHNLLMGTTFIGSVAKTELRTDNTLCMNANGDNSTEIFIEIGKKMSIAYLDKEGFEILPEHINGGVSIELFHSESRLGGHVHVEKVTPGELAKKILFAHEGNSSRPDSHCFRDIEKEKTPYTMYRTTGLGFCSLSRK